VYEAAPPTPNEVEDALSSTNFLRLARAAAKPSIAMTACHKQMWDIEGTVTHSTANNKHTWAGRRRTKERKKPKQ
jgi:hypothetical protein